MISLTTRLIAGAALALVAGGAMAQEQSTNRVAAKTDWSVFVESNPTECWAVSAPKETVNTRDGRVVAVRRGDIYMLVFNRPSANFSSQVQFAGGSPFASGATLAVQVGASSF